MKMKYFLVFILPCLSLAVDAQPMPTDFPPDLTSTIKRAKVPPSTNAPDSPFKVSKTAQRFMATVREAPSDLYLCSATFIRNDALLTTARCLLGREISKLSLHSNASSLEPNGPGNIAIKNIFIHPEFDVSPVTMDFGIITLKNPIKYVTPLSLPTKKIGQPNAVGDMYTWRFTPNFEKFLIHEHKSKIISNPKCYLIEREVIPEDMACVEGLNNQEGEFDHGMPFVIKNKDKDYLFGINRIGRKLPIQKVDRIWKIEGIVPWITDLLKGDSNKNVPTTQKTTIGSINKNYDIDGEAEEREEEEKEDMEDYK